MLWPSLTAILSLSSVIPGMEVTGRTRDLHGLLTTYDAETTDWVSTVIDPVLGPYLAIMAALWMVWAINRQPRR